MAQINTDLEGSIKNTETSVYMKHYLTVDVAGIQSTSITFKRALRVRVVLSLIPGVVVLDVVDAAVVVIVVVVVVVGVVVEDFVVVEVVAVVEVVVVVGLVVVAVVVVAFVVVVVVAVVVVVVVVVGCWSTLMTSFRPSSLPNSAKSRGHITRKPFNKLSPT